MCEVQPWDTTKSCKSGSCMMKVGITLFRQICSDFSRKLKYLVSDVVI